MKLYIDTTMNRIILIIFNQNNDVVASKNVSTNNDALKTINIEIEELFSNSNILYNQINELLITLGPGSFTGVKIPLNIARSWLLFNDQLVIRSIKTYELFFYGNTKSILMPFTKKTFFLIGKKYFGYSMKIISLREIEKFKHSNIIDFSKFNINIIKEMVSKNKFRKETNINSLKPIFPN